MLGKTSSPNMATFPSSRRPSLAPSPSMEQDRSSQGSSPAALPPAQAAINFKRRTSVVSTDIGENILDGVVNEGSSFAQLVTRIWTNQILFVVFIF